jgi:hypothetical protein
MSTLMGAVELLRGRGQLPPSGPISVRNLLQRFQPTPPGFAEGPPVEDVWKCGSESSMGGYSLPL